MKSPEDYNVVFVAFDQLTFLDLLGPHEVIWRAFRNVKIVAEKKGIIRAVSGLEFIADSSFDEIQDADILVVPGGPGQSEAMENKEIISFIEKIGKAAKYNIGVCTGTLLLAKAGLLENKIASTHWLAKNELKKYNSIYSSKRYTWCENVLTGAGVSAGIDLAFELVSRVISEEKCKEILLAIEYDPQPPFDVGAPHKSDIKTIEYLKSKSRFEQN